MPITTPETTVLEPAAVPQTHSEQPGYSTIATDDPLFDSLLLECDNDAHAAAAKYIRRIREEMKDLPEKDRGSKAKRLQAAITRVSSLVQQVVRQKNGSAKKPSGRDLLEKWDKKR